MSTWPLPLPDGLLVRTRDQPLTQLEAVANLECAAIVGSTWARRRLRELEHASDPQVKTAASAASRRLFLKLGTVE